MPEPLRLVILQKKPKWARLGAVEVVVIVSRLALEYHCVVNWHQPRADARSVGPPLLRWRAIDSI